MKSHLKKIIRFLNIFTGVIRTCDIKLGDILVVMDASSSIGYKNFEVQKNFVANVTGAFSVSPTEVRFGALIFDTNPTKKFDLKDYLDNDSLSKVSSSYQLESLDGNNICFNTFYRSLLINRILG